MDYIEYFYSRGVDLEYLANIALSRFNMDRGVIFESAENLYNRIRDGLIVKDLSIGNMIISRARLINTAPPMAHKFVLKRIKQLEYRTKQLELSWWKRDKWAWLFRDSIITPTLW